MITTILASAHPDDLHEARTWTSGQLHAYWADVSQPVAVAYVIRHFRQGDYEGWEGFVAMLEADRLAGE